MSGSPRVGVLSLQGDFGRHRATLEALGATPVRVTLPADLEDLDALILPGGESTTMLRLLDATGLRAPVERFVASRPVLGTCAGLILLARSAGTTPPEDAPGSTATDTAAASAATSLPAPTFGVLDVAVERNAWGRQIDSFSAMVETTVFEGPALGVFIRAPRIRRVGAGVEVVARLPAPHRAGSDRAGGPPAAPEGSAAASASGEPVAVRSGKVVGLCFHPELTLDLRFHRWFLTRVAGLEAGVPEASVEGSAARQGGA